MRFGPRPNRLSVLKAENADLKERVERLEAQLSDTPGEAPCTAGVERGAKSWDIIVGGEVVPIRALPPSAWHSALGELPAFLFAYISQQQSQQEVSADVLDELLERARGWITACAVGEVELTRLTVPEAMDALTRISRLNGIDSSLKRYFQERQDNPDRGPDSQTLRRATPRGDAN